MHDEIIQFWFAEIEPAQWFKKDAEFDNHLYERFSAIHGRARRCELFSWRASAQGRLAEIIILDQFSRNIFRGTPQAFAYDGIALILAQETVSQNLDQKLPLNQRAFLYMPYMHSESLQIHQSADQLFRSPGLESTLEWELRHKKIIERFGRYPHRNKILGRASSEEELNFLEQPNSSF